MPSLSPFPLLCLLVAVGLSSDQIYGGPICALVGLCVLIDFCFFFCFTEWWWWCSCGFVIWLHFWWLGVWFGVVVIVAVVVVAIVVVEWVLCLMSFFVFFSTWWWLVVEWVLWLEGCGGSWLWVFFFFWLLVVVTSGGCGCEFARFRAFVHPNSFVWERVL